jgi:GGDEF domain-containing protein
MVSIKRYLSGNACENTPRQAVALLVEKLGECAVEDDPKECENFRREMRSTCEALSRDTPDENIMILAKSAAQSLETYNRRVVRTVTRLSGQVQAIARMLQNSLLEIAGAGTESGQGWSRIGKELERGTGFKDLESLKAHVGKCLCSLREEIEREKAASKARIEKLQIEIESLHRPSAQVRHQSLDPATGAPLQEDCMAAIRAAIDKGTRHYAVVMVVNRVQPINARYGRDAGDWMLLRFKEHVASQLPASDPLFRWTGPAMVAILERPEGFDYIRAQVRRMLDTRMEITYVFGDRSVLIPVSCAWSVLPLTSPPDAAKREIETFVASQGCHDLVHAEPHRI